MSANDPAGAGGAILVEINDGVKACQSAGAEVFECNFSEQCVLGFQIYF